MRRVGRAVALGVIALAAGAACGDSAPMAPDIAAVTLEGDSVSLAELRGEVVLLNVWATWCAPCRREIPELQALHERYSDQGLRVVGLTVDDRQVGDEIRQFVDEFGMTYDVWWDPDQRVLAALEAVGVPVTVLVGREGRILWRHMGVLEPDDPALRERLVEAIGI